MSGKGKVSVKGNSKVFYGVALVYFLTINPDVLEVSGLIVSKQYRSVVLPGLIDILHSLSQKKNLIEIALHFFSGMMNPYDGKTKHDIISKEVGSGVER